MTVAKLQGSIKSHVSKILEKTEKVNKEARNKSGESQQCCGNQSEFQK